MDKLLTETRYHLKLLSSGLFFDKLFTIKLLKFFNQKIWHEILLHISFIRKNYLLFYFFTKENLVRIDSNFKNQRISTINSNNFLNVCFDEYINGRKYGIKNICITSWKAYFWKELENIIEVIIEKTKKKKEGFALFFFFFECMRFEKISELLKIKKLYENGYPLFRYYLRFVPENNKRILKKIFVTKNERKGAKLTFSKNFLVGNLKQIYTLPFFIKGLKIGCLLSRYSSSLTEINSIRFRKLVHNLSIFGIIGEEVFWIKKPKRIFHTLLTNLILNKLDVEIKTVKKNLKIKTKSSHYKQIEQWDSQFKQKIPSNFEKLGMIFSSCLIDLTYREDLFVDNLFSFNKLSIWGKYMAGCSFSVINSDQRVFYEFLPKLITKDSISDYLKAGLIFGLSLTLKNNNELECSFFKKCKSILKSKEASIVKYGVCLALSNVISGGILCPEKSELFFELKNLIHIDQLLSEGVVLAIGILFFGTGSIFLVKELLFMALESNNDNFTKLLLTSISFILCKNKDCCKYLFINLIGEKNPHIRQGAIFIYSLGNFMNRDLNNANVLLNCLSSENDDNVKFSIVTSFGFIFISNFKLIEEILYQFINHFNPFIRLGFCFALALSSVGLKFVKKQIKILHNLTRDKVDFVSQGACFCLGLLHFYSPTKKGIKKTVKILKSIINSKYESDITKFGAIIGLSIVEKKKEKEIVINQKMLKESATMHLFLQYWTWLPNLCFGFDLFAI